MVSKSVIIITIIVGVLGVGIYFTRNEQSSIPETFAKVGQLIFDVLPFQVPRLKTEVDGSNNSGKPEKDSKQQPTKVFTKEELARYDGKKGSNGLYLAVLGHVYDVDKGRRHYGPDGGYHFFSGRDGTKAFITGDFTEKGLIEDTSELTPKDMLGIKEWKDFYETDYKFVGVLEGLYFNSDGKPTDAFLNAERRIKLGLEMKKSEEDKKKEFPPCNSQWSKKAGGRVWCTKKSGGINRDWVGVPRKLFKRGTSDYRCACIKKSQLDNPLLKEYDDCNPKADSCQYSKK